MRASASLFFGTSSSHPFVSDSSPPPIFRVVGSSPHSVLFDEAIADDRIKIPLRITTRQSSIRQRPFYQSTISRNIVHVPLSNPAPLNTFIPLVSNTPKTTNTLKLVHLNIRSLKNNAHLLELRKFTKSNKIDVLTVSETWLNTSVTNKEIEIEGYKLHRSRSTA